MGTVTFTVTEAGHPDASKQFGVADADIDRFVAAWQREADRPAFVNGGFTGPNGPSSREQVLLVWVTDIMAQASKKIVDHELQIAPQPPKMNVT